MGRRSINTTKSGKYMNPTDQARKEARKQELKKNKKQRQMVRAAVLKGKDPQQILEEMEKIDQMGFSARGSKTLYAARLQLAFTGAHRITGLAPTSLALQTFRLARKG
ncbi:hypothetical protein Zmor_004790 [Zophobas morio]|uniref:Wbp11/ELF5/Saf1 N-terminal domain-containing protein n=1 Tax=Zophobas morio TaxID=2755281 RepID=A0AA38MLN7_9CUCU|nr:hypothetical protein Zmor_004790 [Zophobas morio]